MLHELKCWPEYFAEVKGGLKTYEVRKNDKGFRQGDILKLICWNPASEQLCTEIDPETAQVREVRPLYAMVSLVTDLEPLGKVYGIDLKGIVGIQMGPAYTWPEIERKPGFIMRWFGAVPQNWVECNGENGAPDIQPECANAKVIMTLPGVLDHVPNYKTAAPVLR